MCRKSEVIRRAYGSCLWSFCCGYVFLEQTKSQLLIHILTASFDAAGPISLSGAAGIGSTSLNVNINNDGFTLVNDNPWDYSSGTRTGYASALSVATQELIDELGFAPSPVPTQLLNYGDWVELDGHLLMITEPVTDLSTVISFMPPLKASVASGMVVNYSDPFDVPIAWPPRWPEYTFTLTASLSANGSASASAGAPNGSTTIDISGLGGDGFALVNNNPWDFSKGVRLDYAAALSSAEAALLLELNYTPGESQMLNSGDWMQIDDQLLMIVEPVGANAASITFEPPLRHPVAAGASIDFENPGVIMRLVDDGQVNWSAQQKTVHDAIGFDAVEWIE